MKIKTLPPGVTILFPRLMGVFAFTLMLISSTLAQAAPSHPFLLVETNMYTTLRNRANQAPWSQMKSTAINYVNNNTFPGGSNPDAVDMYSEIGKISGAGALAYILDPNNKTTYKNKVRDVLLKWSQTATAVENQIGGGHSGTVQPGNYLFASIIAYDIVYNDLTSTERNNINANILAAVNTFGSNGGNTWAQSWTAIEGVWALFNGDTSTFTSRQNSYKNNVTAAQAWSPTVDGVNPSGTGYAWSRFCGRMAKAYFMDVCAFTGNYNFYEDPTVIKSYEWMLSGSITPWFSLVSFGDSNPTDLRGKEAYARMVSLHRFSDKAARYAAWQRQSAPAIHANVDHLIFSYLLMDQALAEPEKPKSQIWPDGGAAFWEDNASSLSLLGRLHNATKTGTAHGHKEVNALFVAAYGEMMLVNAGYNGSGQPINSQFTYNNWINKNAKSANVVTINDQDHTVGYDHSGKSGDGITEGFVGGLLDYASGDSGIALNDPDSAVDPATRTGHHQRNFVMVHPQDGKPGYFLLFDEVTALNPAHRVEVLLHPDSTNWTTVSSNTEYRWRMNRFTGNNVDLNIYLATPPQSIAVLDGGFAMYDNSYVGKYLRSRYDADASGKARIVTVLFPNNSTKPKATMTRISGTGYKGAKLDHGTSHLDFAIESAGTGNLTNSGVSFRGKAVVHRQISGNNALYFVRQGRMFNDGASQRRGFSSTADVSIHLRGTSGSIISPGTSVTLYHPNITGVKLNGSTLGNQSTGSGWVQVTVPSGTHTLQLLVGPNAPSGLTATAVSSSQINLSWADNSSNETGFKIERKTGSGGTYAQIATVGAGVTTYNNTTGLSAGTTYYYRVRATNANGDSSFSNEANATTTGVVPNAPSNLTANTISSSQINLSWSDNSSNETGFKIERKTGSGGTYAQIATVGAGVTTYNNTTGLSASTTYYYRVRANNGSGNSAYSNEANATTQGTVPAAPSGLAASAVSSSQINLSWTDNANNETGFKIERKTGAGGTYAQIDTVGAGVTTYNNTTLTASTSYYYRVRAYNANGNSAYSNEANATTQAPIPSAPSALIATATSSSQISLSWTDNANNEVEFEIQRKTGGSYATIATVGANATSFNDSALAASTTYTYQVRSRNASGNSAFSNEAAATTLSVGNDGITVSASSDDGNVPENTLDGDLGTRWSSLGDGEWIKYDLGLSQTVHGVRIAFYGGNTRVAYFDIETSMDDINWTPVFTNGQSSGTTTAFETFNVTNTTARYVRITGHGNSNNLYNSYTEVEILRNEVTVIASTTQDPNYPENTLDNDLSTRWSANGDGEWLEFDLGSIKTVTTVRIAFFAGDVRTAFFDIDTSVDGVNWTSVLTNGQSSGTSLALESFDVINSQAQYVRITGHGNSQSTFNSYTEVEIETIDVTASSSQDPNVPANTLDEDLGTRWSTAGDGEWIKFDLGSPQAVNEVQIAFYAGNVRQAFFDIQTSADNVNWTAVLTNGVSSGTTTALETFDVTNTTARYVRIIGHGNSQNTFNSYTEVEIH